MDNCCKLLKFNNSRIKETRMVTEANSQLNKLLKLCVFDEDVSSNQPSANIFDYLMINVPSKKPKNNENLLLNLLYIFIITLKLFSSRRKINLTKLEFEQDEELISDFHKTIFNQNNLEVDEHIKNYSDLLKIIFSCYVSKYFLLNLKLFKHKSPHLIGLLNNNYIKQFNLFNLYLVGNNNTKTSGLKVKLKLIYFNLTINYFHELIDHFNSTTSAYVQFLSLLKQTYKFIFENLDFICFPVTKYCSDLKEEKQKFYKKLLEILISIRTFKYNLHHVQTCPKHKHTSLTCKQFDRQQQQKSSIQIHNSITCIATTSDDNSGMAHKCLFKKINFKLLIEFMKKNSSYENKKVTLNLLHNFGLCTCVELESVLDLIDLNGILIEDLEGLNRIFNDYFIHLSGLNVENKPILTFDADDVNGLTKHLQKSTLYFKCEEILLKFNDKSYLLMNLLKNTIYKLDKFTFNKQSNLILIIVKLSEVCLDKLCSLDAVNDDVSVNSSCIGIFKTICIYLNQFLSRFNFYFTNVINHVNLNLTYFIELFVQKSLNIYSQIEKLCFKYEIDFKSFIEPISICSNFLIIHEYMNFKFKTSQNSQLILTKSFIVHLSCVFPSLGEHNLTMVSEQAKEDFRLDFHHAIVQILLNSYWKCKIFRLYLNGFTNFATDVLTYVNIYLKSTEKKEVSLTFLETLFDFILTYYYFNSQVSFIFIVLKSL